MPNSLLQLAKEQLAKDVDFSAVASDTLVADKCCSVFSFMELGFKENNIRPF